MPLDLDGARAWVEKARRDLHMAEHALSQGHEYTDQACFHSQQCAEKALKAILAAHGVELVRSHDLVVLLEQTASAGQLEVWEPFRSDLENLSDFCVMPRYPGWEMSVGTIDTKAIVESACRLLNEVERQLALQSCRPT